MTERKVAGRYRLLEPIGEGGMGVVWRSHDELLDRVVAIKEVRHRGVDDAARADLNRRTIREARSAGRLDHPSVIVVHDVVEEDGRPWIVMQLVRSRSLGAVVRREGPLPPARVASVGLHVLGALRAAHAAGVLHRDVKPENVLLADDGRVVLTDFGIASMTQESGITRTGGMVGTPAFLPPERLHGLPATPESDLWSLGATLYAALEGRPPFERATAAATMMAVLQGEPAPMRHAGALPAVITGLMVREPVARMSADEAEALLAQASSGRATEHPDTPTRYGGAARRHDPARPPEWYGEPRHSNNPIHPEAAPHRGDPAWSAEPARHGGTAPGVPSRDGPTRDGGFPAAGGGPLGPPRTGIRRPGAGRLALAAGVPALAVAIGVGGWLMFRETGTVRRPPVAAGSPGGTTSSARPPESPGPGPGTSSPRVSPPVSTPVPTPEAGPRLPEGWRRYRDPVMGFTVGLPAGWSGKRFSGRDRVEFRAPGGRAFLWIESTEDPETHPVRHWEKVERGGLARKIWPGYERRGITPLRYLGGPAADWEFTYLRNGVATHVLDRGFRTSSGRPYAIYWESPEAEWDRTFFDGFTETFRP
ncbi:serine/threonine protein kinase [Streptosporangium violaceochromogenes]|nr:serine/threonine protein kinase [Streptosporangium violaceochromogenes]